MTKDILISRYYIRISVLTKAIYKINEILMTITNTIFMNSTKLFYSMGGS